MEEQFVKVDEIVVRGNSLAKPSYFSHRLNAHCKNNQLNNVDQWRNILQEYTTELYGDNLFEAIDINFNVQPTKQRDNFYHAKLIITVKEKLPGFLQANSFIRSPMSSGEDSSSGFNGNTNNATSMSAGYELKAALRSPLGYGETLSLSTTTNTNQHHEYALTLAIPNNHTLLEQIIGLDGALQVSTKTSQESQYIGISSFRQRSKGFYSHYCSKGNRDQLFFEFSSRDEIPVENKSSSDLSRRSDDDDDDDELEATKPIPDIENNIQIIYRPKHSRICASSSLLYSMIPSNKCSLKYVKTILDSRNNAANPLCGHFLQLTNELAFNPWRILSTSRNRINNFSEFYKCELNSQWHLPLTRLFTENESNSQNNDNDIVLSLAGQLGMMFPLSSGGNYLSQRRSFLSDRFHLGGACNLRGFQVSGVGPRSVTAASNDGSNNNNYNNSTAGSSLGGESKCSLLAMLSMPLYPLPTYVRKIEERFFPNTEEKKTNNSSAAVASLFKIRGFGFLNGGSIGAGLNDYSRLFFGPLRASIGCGIAICIGGNSIKNSAYDAQGKSIPNDDNSLLRWEISYSTPLYASKQDLLQPWQVGISLQIA